jgi:coenzyme F420-0:L-glutamate ligase/coenzyme F420-1:gamma-L-glutamate ligase
VTNLDSPDFYSLVFGRRSVRSYQPEALPRDMIERLLNVAVWAPSAHNRQPWRFAVVTSAESKDRLATRMGERLRNDRNRDGDPVDAIEADARRSYKRITSAPCVIVVCLSMEDMDVYPDGHRSEAEHLMAVQGAALATENLLLAASLEGLGACWMCAPLFCQNTVASALEIPSHWQPQGLITLGYPANQGKEPQRKPLEEMVRWL